MENRNFQLDTEWNVIHYPERPQGFGILIIGDDRHFVDSNTSFWMQNEGKSLLLQTLLDAGYTVFYSNLYGKNWGSEKAVRLSKRLYQHVIRSEILNEKIHILAEGMGALVTLKLIREMEDCIRSVVLLNPILSLNHQLELEKDRKFFYKKMVKELSESFNQSGEQMINKIAEVDAPLNSIPIIPMKILQVLSDSRAYKQSQFLNELSLKWKENNVPISLCYMVPEKRTQMSFPILEFLKKYENI
ncbi:hydrolase [Niallia sp. Krafla_26]|uniref:hydrolase n=1 Tax=Niallia sp. Krafla_26 TaxID=3064703 RepID=UPI003D16792D